jgi:hypothetical protein
MTFGSLKVLMYHLITYVMVHLQFLLPNSVTFRSRDTEHMKNPTEKNVCTVPMTSKKQSKPQQNRLGNSGGTLATNESCLTS